MYNISIWIHNKQQVYTDLYDFSFVIVLRILSLKKINNSCKEQNNQCLVSNIIDREKVKSNKAIKQYVGSKGNNFKQRYMNHKSPINNINKRHTTKLAKYNLNKKDNSTDYRIK